MPTPAVAVINSQVVRGAVGGRAAVFVLERLGYPVWVVPTVVLPWHPGHGRGTRVVPPDFAALLADLVRAPWLGEIGGILTGYVGEPAQVAPIAALVRAVKAANPQCLYLCDPILGDDGRLYQPQATLDAMRGELLPLADIATPNRHELGFLAGRTLADNAALAEAAARLGPREVVVTSAFAAPGEVANLLVTQAGVETVAHPAVPEAPHGTGDVLAALYLAHRLAGAAPADAFRRAVAATVRLIGAADGADELPLAAAQATIAE